MPFWIQILAAADFDPLRAQEMEAGLSARWWNYYLIASKERATVAQAEARKAKHGKRRA